MAARNILRQPAVRRVLGVGVFAGIVAGCATQQATWTRPGATERDVRSAIYWCTTVKVDRMQKFNPSGSDRPRRVSKLDEDCMRKRGFKKVAKN